VLIKIRSRHAVSKEAAFVVGRIKANERHLGCRIKGSSRAGERKTGRPDIRVEEGSKRRGVLGPGLQVATGHAERDIGSSAAHVQLCQIVTELHADEVLARFRAATLLARRSRLRGWYGQGARAGGGCVDLAANNATPYTTAVLVGPGPSR